MRAAGRRPAGARVIGTLSHAPLPDVHKCSSIWPLPPPAPSPQVKPEAKSYYTLAAATLRFNFPKPSFLDGVTSSEKPILAMKKVRRRCMRVRRGGLCSG